MSRPHKDSHNANDHLSTSLKQRSRVSCGICFATLVLFLYVILFVAET